MNETLADLLQIQQLANTAVSVYTVDKKTPTETETTLIPYKLFSFFKMCYIEEKNSERRTYEL